MFIRTDCTAQTALLKISERKGGEGRSFVLYPSFLFHPTLFRSASLSLGENSKREPFTIALSTSLACPAGNIISGGRTHIESEMMMREDPISKSKSNKTLPRARLKLKVVSPWYRQRDVSSLSLFPVVVGGSGRESCSAREVLNNGKQLEKPPPVIDNLSTVAASVLKRLSLSL